MTMFGLPALAMPGHPELMVHIGGEDASDDVSLTFRWDLDFEEVWFDIANVLPQTNDTEFRVRMGSGGSVDSGASDYRLLSAVFGATSFATDVSAGFNAIVIAGDGGANNGISNGTGRGFSAQLFMPRPFDANRFTRIYTGAAGFYNGGGGPYISQAYGSRKAASLVDTVEFSMVSGNIREGTINAWGILPVERAA